MKLREVEENERYGDPRDGSINHFKVQLAYHLSFCISFITLRTREGQDHILSRRITWIEIFSGRRSMIVGKMARRKIAIHIKHGMDILFYYAMTLHCISQVDFRKRCVAT